MFPGDRLIKLDWVTGGKVCFHFSRVLGSVIDCVNVYPGARFSKAEETFRARKGIFSSFVSKNREVFTPETFCMKGTSVIVIILTIIITFI